MMSRALLTLSALAIAAPAALAQTCLKYNVLTLNVIYHDVCSYAWGNCMNATTFMPDFELPSPDGYANGPMSSGTGYMRDYCAAITGPDIYNLSLNLRPWGCTASDCSNSSCYYTDPDTGAGIIAGLAPGMVKKSLGHDLNSPTFSELQDLRQPGVRKSIASEGSFWNWYHSDSTSTIRIDTQLNLTRQYDNFSNNNFETFVYKNDYFFPLDGLGFWNLGDQIYGDDFLPHNFGFTTRIHSDFYYNGGEHFTFQGDDDVWVFLDGQLAIDIGGIHDNQCRSIRLDDLANGGTGHVYNCIDYLNVNYSDIRPGEDFYVSPYFIPGSGVHHRLDVFHAERHSTGSHFAMSTSLALTGTTGVKPKPNGTDYTAPSTLVTKLIIPEVGTNYMVSPLIVYPNTCGTLKDIAVSIPIAPIADTIFHCRVLSAEWVEANGGIDFAASAGSNAIPPPFNLSQIMNVNASAQWATIDNNQDYWVYGCLTTSDDNQTWNVTVHATATGRGYFYCIAEAADYTVFNDYTAIGFARGQGFHTKWVAAAIAANPPAAPSAQIFVGGDSSSMSTGSAIGLGVAIGVIIAFVLGIIVGIVFRKCSFIKGEKHVELEQQQRQLGIGDSENTTQAQLEGTSV